jgi:arsenate reductase (thioredoxin)
VKTQVADGAAAQVVADLFGHCLKLCEILVKTLGNGLCDLHYFMDSIVIFACIHNAGRSQMAAAFFNQAPPSGWRAVSAGTEPANQVHPIVADAMREIGIDLSSAKPQKLTDDLARVAGLLVTMGCGESCPNIPGLRIADWKLEDPKGQSLARVREIRDDIRNRVSTLVRELAMR